MSEIVIIESDSKTCQAVADCVGNPWEMSGSAQTEATSTWPVLSAIICHLARTRDSGNKSKAGTKRFMTVALMLTQTWHERIGEQAKQN